jgi:hypothetical protein
MGRVRANLFQVILPTIQFRIFCLALVYVEIQEVKEAKLSLCLLNYESDPKDVTGSENRTTILDLGTGLR